MDCRLARGRLWRIYRAGSRLGVAARQADEQQAEGEDEESGEDRDQNP